ncbi:MAG: CHASE2 domain-containing protein, partial [Desulfamplus sp.]|nr:CHASE2 domain-containing protein [Desulfamplus sp.]
MKLLKSIIIPLILPVFIFICWNKLPLLEMADFAWRDLLYALKTSQTQTPNTQKTETPQTEISKTPQTQTETPQTEISKTPQTQTETPQTEISKTQASEAETSQNTIDDIVIVAIDELSFQQIKLRWPWPRSLHADLVDHLSNAGAAAIAFDILFPEKSNDESEDIIFSEALKKAGNVVLASNLTITGRQGYETYFVEEPIPLLVSSAAAIGMVNFYPDADGSIRMASNLVDKLPSIAFATVTTALKHQGALNKINENERGAFGALNKMKQAEQGDSIAYLNKIDEGNLFFIDYAGKAGTIPAVSYYQVINDMLDPLFFKDKIVFVGFIADAAVEIESGADSYPYPFMRFTKKMIAGVEIQSNVVRTILRGYPIREFPLPTLKWFCFYILSCILIFVRKNPVYLSISTILILIFASLTSILVFKYHGIMLDIMPAIAGVAVNGLFIGMKEFILSYREKSMLRKAFDSYVSPDVVANVIANSESLKLGGERKRLSVLFSDIRGFTTLSEKLSPEDLVSLLNDYFTRMTDTIFDNNGTLDKYIGDAIMVIFGAPVWSDNHAENACRTALEMKERLEDMNRENAAITHQNSMKHKISDDIHKSVDNIHKSADNFPADSSKKPQSLLKVSHSLAIGIGINTGDMIVGNMGSLRRFDYTVLGDEVNLASRLEGVTKAYGVQI